ncbi:polysaccharide pyruvyl transferase family protein [Specibacter sp. NPDC057265]|uniref:polysaccharide pyruvyl transferase family protein n=1 Tax=Specibacter sp. NPDC057265 TaxID=3346075 RepID=UPI0036341390
MYSTSQAKLPQILILHAYSPNNSGDGLLVELAKKIVLEALGEVEFRICASDAESFGGPEYLQWSTPYKGINSFVGRRAAMLLTVFLGPNKEVKQIARQADLIVAVGGGYLRGGNISAAVKSWGAHFGQLKMAAKYGHKSVYLSQSIGPFHGIYKKAVTKNLGKISAVFVRDDRSAREYKLAAVRRAPDMAVLELASLSIQPEQTLSELPPVMVAREIVGPRNYYKFLQEASDSKHFEWALQSTGGANDDYALTKRSGGSEPHKLKTILEQNDPRIVVSTRLHGALSSLIAGYPAIHLSYERKGWGAYEDLGLDEFVVNARDVTLPDVQRLMEKIIRDPGAFWDRILEKRPQILENYNQILATLQDISRDGRETTGK